MNPPFQVRDSLAADFGYFVVYLAEKEKKEFLRREFLGGYMGSDFLYINFGAPYLAGCSPCFDWTCCILIFRLLNEFFKKKPSFPLVLK